ncbi:hypothetical protein EPUL_002192 [Erysiphe pulchra]|uniref:Endonuclease/exonuclease/phosphatase domain-containing protein n=1 Tax=Erysiphe pulchra TaxID=225359 RepID=A0A2S4PXG2_9PEZI|nr:hypothetical protein EPUL_002192 [Erysiphe pulchra]
MAGLSRIWNIYNAPLGSDETGNGLTTLLSCNNTLYFVGGDYNLQHALLDLDVDHPQATSQAFIDWHSSRGLKLLNPTETPTHNCSGTLDLSFSTDNKARCEVSILFRETSIQDPGNFRYDAFDETELEVEAKDIIEIITAFSGSCPRTKANKAGISWWNEECKQASRAYRIARCTNSLRNKNRVSRS